MRVDSTHRNGIKGSTKTKKKRKKIDRFDKESPTHRNEIERSTSKKKKWKKFDGSFKKSDRNGVKTSTKKSDEFEESNKQSSVEILALKIVAKYLEEMGLYDLRGNIKTLFKSCLFGCLVYKQTIVNFEYLLIVSSLSLLYES
jgi:hypothetical protein